MDKKEISFVSEYNKNKELTLTKYLGKNDDIIVVEDGITERNRKLCVLSMHCKRNNHS